MNGRITRRRLVRVTDDGRRVVLRTWTPQSGWIENPPLSNSRQTYGSVITQSRPASLRLPSDDELRRMRERFRPVEGTTDRRRFAPPLGRSARRHPPNHSTAPTQSGQSGPAASRLDTTLRSES